MTHIVVMFVFVIILVMVASINVKDAARFVVVAMDIEFIHVSNASIFIVIIAALKKNEQRKPIMMIRIHISRIIDLDLIQHRNSFFSLTLMIIIRKNKIYTNPIIDTSLFESSIERDLRMLFEKFVHQ